MLRTILIVLLVVMATVPATAKWEMEEFVILLGWAESVECPDDEAMMQAIAQLDFNVVMWYDANQLDLAHTYGLKLLVQPGLVDWVIEHPALWGFYVRDEPAIEDFPEVAQQVELIHQTDPNHPAYVNAAGATGEWLDSFMEALHPRVLSVTGRYQWWWGSEQYFAILEAYRSAALAAGIPLIRWVEVNANPDAALDFGVEVPPPPDNAEKLRESVYSSLCYGVKGIQWFTAAIMFEPGTSRLRACALDVAAINAELKQLGPILVGLESVDVFHTPPLPEGTTQLPDDYWVQTDTPDLVLGMLKDNQDNDYIMVANRKIDEERQVVLSLPAAVTEVAKFDKNEGKWINLPLSRHEGRRVVEFSLALGDGELLEVGTTPTTEIEIIQPLNNAVIFSTNPLIQASITDPKSGVDETTIELEIDTDVYTLGDFTYDAESGLLVYEADLDAGLHQVTVRAKNNNGDEAEKTISFRILEKSFDAGLHLFSLPYTYDPGQFPTPDSLFGLSPGEVAMHRWWPGDSNSNKYRTYPDNYGTFNPPDAMGGNPIVDSPPAGLGYFIHLPEQATVQEPGTILDDAVTSYEIDLTYGLVPPRGWNMIGSPFIGGVGWGSVQFITDGEVQSVTEAVEDGVTDGILWEFVSTGDGGYYDFPAIPLSATLEPFKGYWVHIWEDTTVRLYAPSLGGAGVASADVSGSFDIDGGWQLQIIASAGGDLDPSNYIGVSSKATAGYDPGLDVTEPPLVGSAIQCYQPRDGWDQYAGRYARDIRPSTSDTQTWDMEVSCGLSEVPVKLTWPDLNAVVPDNIKLILEDLDSGQQIYMRTVSGYSFTSPDGGGVRHLRITTYDDSVTSLTLTGVSAQAMSPSGGAVITYSLSKPATVVTEICNISGVIIKGLGERSSTGSQVEMVLWDGRSDRGTKVPAGRYLARITARAADGQTVQAVRPFVILP